jgi:hypothetical protein
MPQATDAPQTAELASEEPPETPKRGPGRPLGSRPTYTSELADAICERIASGLSLRKTCAELGISETCVRWWVIKDHEGFHAHYSRAREAQYEVWADEIKEISDECREGVIVTRETDAKGKLVSVKSKRSDMIERARLQIDARKWLLSKLHHKRYGDRLDLIADSGNTVNVYLVRGETVGEKPVEAIPIESKQLPA